MSSWENINAVNGISQIVAMNVNMAAWYTHKATLALSAGMLRCFWMYQSPTISNTNSMMVDSARTILQLMENNEFNAL